MARSLSSGLAAVFDKAATMAAYAQTARSRKKNRAEALSHEQRVAILGRLATRYDEVSMFREPRAIAPRSRKVRALADGSVIDLTWDSAYVPHLSDLAERYARVAPNRNGEVRLFRHARERRAVTVLVHGYMAGHYIVEERMWPVRWLYDKLGLDVALFTLPFHGARAIPGRLGPPPFPGSDPRLSNEGFCQAMGDLRDLVAWLHERGHPAAGVMGMSLGGYTTSLAATVEPRLAFAIPVIPLASLADFARDHGRLGSDAATQEREHVALDRVHHPISPLHRPLAIDPARVLIVAAEADRITPIAHAQRLAEHFAVPLETWHGGHLLQFGRREKFRRIGHFLDERGVTSR